jgi:hypothetical protein
MKSTIRKKLPNIGSQTHEKKNCKKKTKVDKKRSTKRTTRIKKEKEKIDDLAVLEDLPPDRDVPKIPQKRTRRTKKTKRRDRRPRRKS